MKEINLDVFQREYNLLKNQYNQSRNLKIWEVLNENKRNKKGDTYKEADSGIKFKLIKKILFFLVITL